VEFRQDRLSVGGSEPLFEDVHLQRGGRVEGNRLRLQGRWAGLFLRVRPEGRARHLQLRIAGSGQGVLYVGERSFWTPGTRWSTYQMAGPVVIRHPYDYPRSGGADLIVTTGLGGGQASLEWVSLAPAGDPLRPAAVP
jgi:hypothetical protein